MRRFAVVFTLTVALGLLLAGPLMAQPPVMGVYGSATVNGEPAPSGTEVIAFIEGVAVARVSVSGGTYNIRIAQPEGASYQGKTVSFAVGGQGARETTVWQAGDNQPLNLTVASSISVAVALANIAGQYTIVWGYDAQGQQWQAYDPAAPSASDLAVLKRGQGYWIKASQDTTITYNGNAYPLARGWNLIGWLG